MNAINRGLFFVVVALIAIGSVQQRADAASLASGDLVISEVMANPAAVGDLDGEWFELFNSTGSTIDLDGLVLSDAGTDSHTITGTLLLGPGGYLVLGRNGDSETNGGYTADYVYADFSLGNTGDEIIITDISEGSTVVASLAYTSGFAVSGVSRELAPGSTPPFSESNYILATTAYGDGDLGTPGAPVPEPSPAVLLALGLVGIAARRRHTPR